MSQIERDQRKKESVYVQIRALAERIDQLEVPPTLNKKSYRYVVDIFEKLIAIERSLWEINDDSLDIMDGTKLRYLLRDFEVDHSLPSTFTTIRAILQIAQSEYFHQPDCAPIIASHLTKLSIKLKLLAQAITEISNP